MEKIEFHDTNPFHEMIHAYCLAISGLTLYRPEMRPCLETIYKNFDGKVVGLASKEHGSLRIDPIEKMQQVQAGFIDLTRVTHKLLYMLLNTSYEAVKDRLDKNNPAHEFFRHVRHAASHGGNWTFKGSEPTRIAEWRKRKLDPTMQGSPMLTTSFEPGDAIVLLMDIAESL